MPLLLHMRNVWNVATNQFPPCELCAVHFNLQKAGNMLYLSKENQSHYTYCKLQTQSASDAARSSPINQSEVHLCRRFIKLSKSDQRWHLQDDL